MAQVITAEQLRAFDTPDFNPNVTTIRPHRHHPAWTLGTDVSSAQTSQEALEMANLNWKVLQKEATYTYKGNKITVPDMKVNFRSDLLDDTGFLGMVSDRYKIVQNDVAFNFTDELCKEYEGNIHFDKFGSHDNGRVIWMSMKMDDTTILGDNVSQYICFTNTHDGTGSVHAFVTPVRLICSNVINIAIKRADRSWSMRHIGDISYKIEEAKKALQLTAKYMTALDEEADRLANIKVSDDRVVALVKELFPINNEMSMRAIENTLDSRKQFLECYTASDIKKFQGTAWGVVNAAADFADHAEVKRHTSTYESNNWQKVMAGSKVLDLSYARMTA